MPWRTFHIKSAVLSGNRNPYQQDPSASNSKSAISRIRFLRLASITICRTRQDTRSIRIEKPIAVWFRPYLLWQPVFQYYWDAGGNSCIPNAAIFGSRVKVDF